jgi:hypothetical protein
MKWISVHDNLPKHHQTVLVAANGAKGGKELGQVVAIFFDAKIMNEFLASQGIKPDNESAKYFFCSQENKGNVLGGVTHWMHLPEQPK